MTVAVIIIIINTHIHSAPLRQSFPACFYAVVGEEHQQRRETLEIMCALSILLEGCW